MKIGDDMEIEPGILLSNIESPEDLRKLNEGDLPLLCDELRQFIIENVSKNPGHLGASLGVVELSVALHYTYNTPNDKLIWDVGHQAYAHKILTGRRDKFFTNRMINGISGFPRISESEYDCFGTGHSSTSISALLGMAKAAKIRGDHQRHHIAIIGDGSMTAGQAMEALNNAGVSDTDILVVLNDNGIAIDKNVGAMSEYLTKITTSRMYNRLKDKIWFLLGGGSKYGANTRAIVKQVGGAVKSTLLEKSNLFEAFNFRYFGPVDGHDVVRLSKLMRDLQNIPGPKLLHCVTVKGKGFEKAERDQTTYHSPGIFDKETGELKKDPCPHKPPKYQHVFGLTLVELARINEKIVGVTPAMPTGSSLNIMMNEMPERAFDVGIAEQHAVTFSAGLARDGMLPFCNIYSSFMQRGYDQLIHDVALQNLHVVFCLDRGGIVGEDGATHHGVFDLAYLRAIPGVVICSPMDEIELRNLMFMSQKEGTGPIAIRYPRGRGVHSEWRHEFLSIEPGTGRKISAGSGLAILSIGPVGNYVTEAAKKLNDEGFSISHYDMRFLKPIDEALLHEAFKEHTSIITVEDGSIIGGMGSAVLEFASDNNYKAKIVRLGVPDRFIEQGSVEELHALCGYDTDGILSAAKILLGN